MNGTITRPTESLFKGVNWLFGLYILFSQATFLIGYYFLPDGFLRGSAMTAAGQVASRPGSFWEEFALTLLFNLGWQVGPIVVLNFNRVSGMPVGYLIPISLAITGG